MAAVASVAGSSGGYVWEDPGDSIMIQVSLEVVERLGIAVQQGLGAGPRGIEIGGILLGRMLPGYGRTVLVEDFELSPCEHLRGASYTLSPRDRRLLGARMARRAGVQVVGYFRSHTRPGMYLDQDDFAVFSQYFPEAWQVFLLVRPSNDGPATGGFFFWEDGDINRRSTYRQFPFDSAALMADGFPITGGQPAVKPVAPRPVPVSVRPKPVPAPVRAARRLPSLPWIVVPIIAVLFLIAGLFVSENQTPAREVAAVKTSPPPVEQLLPEPAPRQTVAPGAAVSAPAVEGVAPPADALPAATSQPAMTKPTAHRAKKPVVKVIPAPQVPAVHATTHEFAPPPALAAPLQLEGRLAAVLPSRVNTAPVPEVAVSYDAPRGGVFRRALHKIEGNDGAEAGGFKDAVPVRKVSPVRPASVSAEAKAVDVKVSIDDAGHVNRAQLVSKNSELGAVALAAARQWQFTPARKHDRPVASEMVLHFRF